MEGVDRVSSVSQEGVSVVTIELKTNVDVGTAQRDAERKSVKSKAIFRMIQMILLSGNSIQMNYLCCVSEQTRN